MAGRIYKPGEEAFKAVCSILLAGGVVVYPSDTVYGLLADGFRENACRKLCELKGCSFPRPFILLVASIDDALSLTGCRRVLPQMEKYWPGPVTLVLPAGEEIPPWLAGSGNSIALRVPADPLSGRILAETSLRLITTSANPAGEPTPSGIEDIAEPIIEGVDATIDGGLFTGRKPSRIIDLTGKEERILR